jgi:glutamine---fructose-6-phosphate transaminase (isomerizing)
VTKFLQDILRQPGELLRAIDQIGGSAARSIETAAHAVAQAQHLYLTGIGASWNIALSVASLFHSAGRPVYMLDAAELLGFATIPPDSVIIAISRSGRSVEIVKLLAKARAAEATVIGITNAAEGPLARQGQIPIVISVQPDRGISVNTYCTLAAAAAALAVSTVRPLDVLLTSWLARAVAATGEFLPRWQEQLAETSWLEPNTAYYFLARGSSLGSCHEAALLWEEGAKSPAVAMGTGAFRHGPQEAVVPGTRFGIWIHEEHLREQDLAVAQDLRRWGASVMLIGRRIPSDAADVIFDLPEFPSGWQFLIDTIPAQLATDRLAQLLGVDCDSFRYASYIVEDDNGLAQENTAETTSWG